MNTFAAVVTSRVDDEVLHARLLLPTTYICVFLGLRRRSDARNKKNITNLLHKLPLLAAKKKGRAFWLLLILITKQDKTLRENDEKIGVI